jgi:hypothetical protein
MRPANAANVVLVDLFVAVLKESSVVFAVVLILKGRIQRVGQQR